jgi:SAM-dependent methyltransferase
MQPSTVLVMPSRPSESVAFDFDVFLRCKPFLARKDKHLVAVIVESILPITRLGRSRVRFLDIGSGEGTVIHEISRRLKRNAQTATKGPAKIHIDCVEPCSEGISFLRELAKKDSNDEYILHETTIESFLQSARSVYDVINCCHVLYHIPKERWPSLVANLISVLQPGGALFLNLVSIRSDIYRIKEKLTEDSSFRQLRRDYDRFGFDFFAEDLEPVVCEIGGRWKVKEISSDIVFSKEDIVHGVLHGFLSFMYRVEDKQFLKATGDKVLGLLNLEKGGVRFKSIDKMFVYEKGGRT